MVCETDGVKTDPVVAQVSRPLKTRDFLAFLQALIPLATLVRTSSSNTRHGGVALWVLLSNLQDVNTDASQAKYEKDIECGGGYVKIGPKLSDPTTFGDPTPYNIMFGPDKCGYTKRTHLIFNYKGKNVLKKSDLAYKQEGEGTSHVYRLVLKPDNTARVEIDGEKIYEGSLKEDWELLAPKEIKDPEDKKPSDWVDDSMMDDPEAGPEITKRRSENSDRGFDSYGKNQPHKVLDICFGSIVLKSWRPGCGARKVRKPCLFTMPCFLRTT